MFPWTWETFRERSGATKIERVRTRGKSKLWLFCDNVIIECHHVFFKTQNNYKCGLSYKSYSSWSSCYIVEPKRNAEVRWKDHNENTRKSFEATSTTVLHEPLSQSSDKLEPNSFLQSKKIVFIYSSFLKNWNMFISQSNKAYLTSLMVMLLHLLVDNGQLEHCVSFMPK